MTVDNETDERVIGALPARVAGIVFWGLVVIGMLVVAVMLNGRENQIIQRHQAVVDRFVSDLYHELAWENASDAEAIAAVGERLLGSSGLIESLVVEAHGQLIRKGESAPGMVSYIRPVWLASDNGFPLQIPAKVTLYLPSVDQQVVKERKQLLLGMGGLFLLFGLILQKVLDRFLTRPFTQMVDAACAFSSGNERVRFDEQRRDEFGYLGGFINRALDYALQQQQALQQALARTRQSERELSQEKQKAVVTLHSIGEAVITTDRQGRIAYMNPVAEDLLGVMFTELKDAPLGKVMRLIDENSGKPLPNPVDQCLQTETKIVESGHKLLVRHDGLQVAITDTAAPIRDEHGELEGVVMVFHDVDKARKLARQLSHQARHDPLTGLLNRREFEAQLSQRLDNAQTDSRQHAVCYIDLDQFKVVNDVCGHTAGDELLRQLAELLQAQVREADVLARLGGDEFGVLLTHCNAEQAVRIAENIRTTVRNFRFLYQDRSFEVGASIGVVAITRESRSISELMSAVDIACYAAKDGGRNRVHLFKPTDQEIAERRGEMDWVSEIRDAFEQQRFYLLCQPIVSLSEADRGIPGHYELLLRMRDSMGREILPMAFLPAAERYDLMAEIDNWVVRSAMGYIARSDTLPGNCIFLVNVSGKSLAAPEFVDFLETQVRDNGVPEQRICFEVSEASAISNLRTLGDSIKRLRQLGCRIALDDFGSSLSSFGYLKNMQIDYIKIDGGLVRDMQSDRIDAALVEAINEIAHVVGVQTIAEFVETEEILHALCRLGVDYAQGHCIALPRPIEELFQANHSRPPLKLVSS
ncbi:MAG: EAL domain-containing protein [Thiogranum sp.]|nr:EAL domain-containing protein [Thiogranum sp.]